MKGKETSVKKIDARGLSCPQPVIMAKRGIEEISKGESVEILVDTDTARENVARLAMSLGCQTDVRESQEGYVINISKK
ncbi:MAG: sulfurtransferase TusA family protein [bacterium]